MNNDNVTDNNSENLAAVPDTKSSNTHTRRSFMKRVLAAGAAVGAANLAGTASTAADLAGRGPQYPPLDVCGDGAERRIQAYKIRIQAAAQEFDQPIPKHIDNGDEDRYPNKIGSYSKGLPHNELGEVDPNAYQIYLRALASGAPSALERIPLGCPDPENRFPLVNPQAGLAFDLEGIDSHATYMPPAPSVGSAEETGEILENYWMAVTRDVPFSEYATNPLTLQACADLSRLSVFKGPKVNGQVTPGTLFRSDFPGCLVGPYNSQFRYLNCPMGSNVVAQKIRTALPGQDFMTDYQEWLDIQNGCLPQATLQLDPVSRYIRNGRDAGQYVHVDALYQAYLQAALILVYPPSTDAESSGMGAPFDPKNPYLKSINQTGFGTFGAPHIESLMTEVATRALKAVWFQKWFVHRRVRPEAYAGLIQNTLTGAAKYPVVTKELLASPVLKLICKTYGSYLLPMAYPEGCPLHPAYGSGHATVAGACVTMLKAFFDESYVIPNPVQPTPDGLALEPYTGPALTVGGELNKLATNVALGRDIAGVHWRSCATEALKLGETVAISILKDQFITYNEIREGFFKGFKLTKFDGTTIIVS